ncbi:hypothetical protein CWI35_11455 [[Bacillus] caldolyticus]|uniref:Uncharacterized protein n=1 Tax=Bacillus caldolyticus TaxID=1394 RepID=A0ABN5FV18_BACCL|nr:hypothetical protein CWI35_11455 [[Bacillus] caldolyticus]
MKGAEIGPFGVPFFPFLFFCFIHRIRNWKTPSERMCKRSEINCKIRNNSQKFCTLFRNPSEII